MPRNILFLDQDSTLGEFHPEPKGLFPGVVEFIQKQRVAGRELYIATDSEAVRSVLAEIEPLSGYLGSGHIGSGNTQHYIATDGTPTRVDLDFIRRGDIDIEQMRHEVEEYERLFQQLEPDDHSPKREEKRARFLELNKLFNTLVHKVTFQPFDESTRYHNPFNKPGGFKDLYLARRIIAPKEYKDLRTVMVGDSGDITTVCSDPETPLIVISDVQRQGDWNLVNVMLDVLFGDGRNDAASPYESAKPYEVFDSLFSSLRPVAPKALMQKGIAFSTDLAKDKLRLYSHEGIEYVLGRLERNADTRIVLL